MAEPNEQVLTRTVASEQCEEFIRVIEAKNHALGLSYVSADEAHMMMTQFDCPYVFPRPCYKLCTYVLHVDDATTYYLMRYTTSKYVKNKEEVEACTHDRFRYLLYVGRMRTAPQWAIRYTDGSPASMADNDMMLKYALMPDAEVGYYIEEYDEMEIMAL